AALEELKRELLEWQKPVVCIRGESGIGKSQIALAYAYWLKETHADLSIFWVHAATVEQFRSSFAFIAQECQIPDYDAPDANVLPLVKEWLESKSCPRWLMVIDGADTNKMRFDPDNTKSWKEYIPEQEHGSVLITTRSSPSDLNPFSGYPLIEIKVFKKTEANEMLQVSSGQDNPRFDDLSALSSQLKRAPLALVLAAAFIRHRGISTTQYLQLIHGRIRNLKIHLSYTIPDLVEAIWAVSFDQIQFQNPFAGELLSVISFFDGRAIPAKFLKLY
ncbi:P-loop containing nucleoside triphosphate hydrolase protein, partial [Mariannaea sp. PMI_226]